MEPVLFKALEHIRNNIPEIAGLLKIDDDGNIPSWENVVDSKLLSRFTPDFPMVAAICGGGSSGKSTLFNSLLGEQRAPMGGKAGINRRVLFSVPAVHHERPGVLANLAAPFKSTAVPLKSADDLLTPGNPVYIVNQTAPANLVLLDTPDFDTGAQGQYANRDITQMALEASDILIYVFTNSNYNNRDNTDFISQILTGIGTRKCFLVYRVYPNYTEEEVHEHAMTVAEAIYGTEAENYVLGIYRTDEDNRVAAGEQLMKLRPLQSDGPEFWDALKAIDAETLRLELHASVLNDILEQAGQVLAHAKVSLDELVLYHDALRMAQSHCVHEALKHFPMDRVMRRFAQIWSGTDPGHVKFMRKTGAVIDFPLKMVTSAVGWTRGQISSQKKGKTSSHDFSKQIEEDLVGAVNSLHQQTVSPQISVSGPKSDPDVRRMLKTIDDIKAGKALSQVDSPRAEPAVEGNAYTFSVDTHPVAWAEQEKMRHIDFKSVLSSITSQKDTILEIPQDMEKDLRQLADTIRSQMGFWAKVGQTFWAFLNVLPATVAVTYVLSTGDPVGATGIKIKLAGLFGAKDLYALFAIPATTGLKKADHKRLAAMLGPIAQTWLNHKLKSIQNLFEQKITGEILAISQKTIDDADQRIVSLEESMTLFEKEVRSK